MALSAEFLRHINEALAAGKSVEAAIWESHKRAVEADEAAGTIKQLPVETPIQTASVVDSGFGLKADLIKLTTATFHDYLMENRESRREEIALPETYISPEIVEVYNMLAGEGYDVAPIAYVDGKRKEVRIGVFETVARPDYTDGTQMYYSPRRDPLTDILVKGRERNRIAVPSFVEHVPVNSRFAVSWDEINKYVVPEAIKTTPHLAQQLTKGGIILDIPDRADFRSAGQTYEDKLVANSWEWVQDKARFGSRHIAGSRGHGGLRAVGDWQSGGHDDGIGFRFQAVSRPQPLPR